MIDEYKLLISKFEDLIDTVLRGKPYAFTHFLSLDEQAIAESLANRSKIGCFKYGGYYDCERSIIVFYETNKPEYYLFPYSVLMFKFKDDCTINHRDVLGSIMALGLKRETIGDIIFLNNTCYIFVLDTISEYIQQNLYCIKNSSVSLSVYNGEIDYVREYEEIICILSSMRLDCLVAEIASLSRSRACELIEAGLVNLNGIQCQRKDKSIAVGDIVSVRKKGKFRLDRLCGKTKKDKIKLKILKYI